jgi:aminoglycoside 2'-N-acetyltransferase I
MSPHANDVEVRTIPTEELSAERRSEIIRVCIAAHDNEDFENLFTYIPSGGRHFLAYRGSELLSHAVVTTRWAQPEGHPVLRTAYVDAVSTLPDAQGRGFASATMRALAAGIDDYEIAGLETQRETFYERLGWEIWRGPLAGRTEDGLIPTPDVRSVMVLRLPRTPAIDLDLGMTIERQAERIW